MGQYGPCEVIGKSDCPHSLREWSGLDPVLGPYSYGWCSLGCAPRSVEPSAVVAGWKLPSSLHFPLLSHSQALVEEMVCVLLLLLSLPPSSSLSFLFPVPSVGSVNCRGHFRNRMSCLPCRPTSSFLSFLGSLVHPLPEI